VHYILPNGTENHNGSKEKYIHLPFTKAKLEESDATVEHIFTGVFKVERRSLCDE